MTPQSQRDLARLYRAESGRIIAALMHQCRNLAVVEDALQDAYLQACQQWPERGQPRDAVAWLHRVAKCRLIDRLRRERVSTRVSAQHEIALRYQWRTEDRERHLSIPDDRLRLIFTCCHPALSPEAQVALTLKVICGLSSREIARAYLLHEDTLNRRLSRAKQKIALLGIAYEVPEGAALQSRLSGVLAVIYLMFNESYQACEGPRLTRADLAQEAIRLGRLLYELQPSAEAGGLLALMQLHGARQAARRSDHETYIPLETQDRSHWDHLAIDRSCTFLIDIMARGTIGVYQIQAAISALHCKASSFAEVDWPQVAGLYEQLYRRLPTAVVLLNYWVARSYVDDAKTVIEKLSELAEPLQNYQPYHAACADIARRAHVPLLAAEAYRRAIHLSSNDSERQFLQARLEQLAREA